MTRAARGRMLTAVERLELVRCLLERRLDCGCAVGLYQTLAGGVLAIVDNPDDDCPDRGHQADFVIAADVAPGDLSTPTHGEAA